MTIQRYFPITSFEVDLILGDRNIQVELINGKIGTPENFVFLGTYTKLLGGGEIFKYEAQSRNLIENSYFCSHYHSRLLLLSNCRVLPKNILIS